MIQGRMNALGYSPEASRAIAHMLIGGLTHIGKSILYGEIKSAEVERLVRGIRELFKTKAKIKKPKKRTRMVG
jgi:hypothetical protein